MNAGRIAWSIVGLLTISAPTKSSDPIAILTPSDAAQGLGGGFGYSVAISGDWLVMGAPDDDQFEYDAGSAYVFRRVGTRWVEQEKLDGPALFEEHFGTSVAIDGDWMVIGAAGQGFVFRRNDRATPQDLSDDFWYLAAILNPPPSHLGKSFGSVVRIHGDVIVVGAPRGESAPGRAYIFQWDGDEWTGPQTIVPFNSESGDQFGNGVAVNGDTVAVAAENLTDPLTGFHSSTVYLFRRDDAEWVEQQTLNGAEIGSGQYLGSALSMSDNLLLTGGAYWRPPRLNFLPAAHVFRFKGQFWSYDASITKENVFPYYGFAGRVATDEEKLLISSGADPWGYVYRYSQEEWCEVDQLAGVDRIAPPPVAVHRRFALVLNYVYAVGERFALADFAAFQNCYGHEAVMSGCAGFDLELDGFVDARDLPLWLLTFRGP